MGSHKPPRASSHGNGDDGNEVADPSAFLPELKYWCRVDNGASVIEGEACRAAAPLFFLLESAPGSLPPPSPLLVDGENACNSGGACEEEEEEGAAAALSLSAALW
mmetsp:Transcript_8220/g.15758  ORF Transcript_8220/g.15758 Transcript_8220/m.15758 type:complete len:106 (-) Transcript_8220:274-591(-)